MVTEKTPNYTCPNCDFITGNKKDFEKHKLTAKHKKRALGDSGDKKNPAGNCDFCNKFYKSRNGLWKHIKLCALNKTHPVGLPNETILNTIICDNTQFKNLILEIVKNNAELQKQNTELQKQLVDVCKKSSTHINNSHNTQNSHNKTFNLQFFLNEQCKDAMNMSDFVNTFQLQLADLESVGDLGYVEGISKIIVDRLNSLDIYKRPMHCSDVKREILYIKDEDKWEKEERHNPKLRKAIQTVSFKNMKLVTTWSDTYPESKNGESRLNDRYMKLIKQSTGGNGETADNEDKIIRRIAKEIVIDKK